MIIYRDGHKRRNASPSSKSTVFPSPSSVPLITPKKLEKIFQHAYSTAFVARYVIFRDRQYIYRMYEYVITGTRSLIYDFIFLFAFSSDSFPKYVSSTGQKNSYFSNKSKFLCSKVLFLRKQIFFVVLKRILLMILYKKSTVLFSYVFLIHNFSLFIPLLLILKRNQ